MNPPARRHQDAEEDDGGDPPALEAEVEHHEHDEHGYRHEDAHALRGPDLVLELAAPFPIVTGRQLEPAITHGFREQFLGSFGVALLDAVENARDVAHRANPNEQRENVECRKRVMLCWRLTHPREGKAVEDYRAIVR